ncbi:hypothetical protein HanXRQr2_Chr14g0624431 [Helianthus annuus]|uniref:Secreted protein n=1 Tax=Helianthus annuus TaxID=4232 RepID=A0A251SE72_HELAN|nr:hypothetical protein HanXRQr2_Chr14g0624431 [Helianthus annuus]
MSSLDKSPLLAIVILLLLPVDIASAETLRIIPFASMLKQTLIFSTPLGAAGTPSRLKVSRKMFSLVYLPSP